MKKIIVLSLFVFLISSTVFAQQLFLGLGYVGVNAITGIVKNPKLKKNKKEYSEMMSNYSTVNNGYACEKTPAVLNLTQDQSIPSKDNSLTFRNHDDIYKIKNPFGYCWGHANITSKFNRLAIFRPDQQIEAKVDSKEWKKFYKKLINDIANKNEAKIIPGFKNLHEMSSHPYLEKRLARAVQNSWAKTAIKLKGLKAGKIKENTVEEKTKLFHGIVKRIENKQFPLVTLHYLGENFLETHIVILWRYDGEVSPGIHQFCSRDNNSEYKLNEACNNKFLINFEQPGPVLYHQQKYADIEGITFSVGVDFSYLEDSDSMEQIKSLEILCREQNL